jgi:hypothetical protein
MKSEVLSEDWILGLFQVVGFHPVESGQLCKLSYQICLAIIVFINSVVMMSLEVTDKAFKSTTGFVNVIESKENPSDSFIG